MRSLLSLRTSIVAGKPDGEGRGVEQHRAGRKAIRHRGKRGSSMRPSLTRGRYWSAHDRRRRPADARQRGEPLIDDRTGIGEHHREPVVGRPYRCAINRVLGGRQHERLVRTGAANGDRDRHIRRQVIGRRRNCDGGAAGTPVKNRPEVTVLPPADRVTLTVSPALVSRANHAFDTYMLTPRKALAATCNWPAAAVRVTACQAHAQAGRTHP